METSSSRFKSLAITAGLSFWFSIITFSTGYFSFEILAIFVVILLTVTQIFANKISKLLDIFAIFNTKVFLSILFIFVISIYGILFRFLRIDLLRLKTQRDSYWLKIESSDNDRKQF
tara:strand:+ start:2119 stop:2469 length:351 start_codon:yes stop_codon:yes gene_type:complete